MSLLFLQICNKFNIKEKTADPAVSGSRARCFYEHTFCIAFFSEYVWQRLVFSEDISLESLCVVVVYRAVLEAVGCFEL